MHDKWLLLRTNRPIAAPSSGFFLIAKQSIFLSFSPCCLAGSPHYAWLAQAWCYRQVCGLEVNSIMTRQK